MIGCVISLQLVITNNKIDLPLPENWYARITRQTHDVGKSGVKMIAATEFVFRPCSRSHGILDQAIPVASDKPYDIEEYKLILRQALCH